MVQQKGTARAQVQAPVIADEEERDAWQLESGLPNDVDAFIANSKFGYREEYQQQVIATSRGESAGLMFMCDLVDENGEPMGNAGWSVGSGWMAEDDGATLSHPKRKNVVASSRYGQLQHRVVAEIKVDMKQYGTPLVAKTWDGLGFHWMLEEHETLKQVEGGGREKKQGLMPTAFIGVNEAIRGGAVGPAAAPAKKEVGIDANLQKQLKDLAQTNSFRDFVKAAVKMPAVAMNDELMSSVMDDGPSGFFSTNQK